MNTASPTKAKRKSTAAKLALTAGALAAIAPAQDSNADIVYLDYQFVIGVPSSPDGTRTNWDIDGDGNAEFALLTDKSSYATFNYYSSQSFLSTSMAHGTLRLASGLGTGSALNGRGFVGIGAGGYDVFGLQNNDKVGPTLSAGYAWGTSPVTYRELMRYDRIFSNSQSGNYYFVGSAIGADMDNIDFGSNFVGFRFDMNGQLHYGWAELEIVGGFAVFTRWAYESDANTSILVGATQTVPEPGGLAMLALGAAGVMSLRRRKAAK